MNIAYILSIVAALLCTAPKAEAPITMAVFTLSYNTETGMAYVVTEHNPQWVYDDCHALYMLLDFADNICTEDKVNYLKSLGLPAQDTVKSSKKF